MNENDIKQQIQDAKKPTDGKNQKDTDSARRIVERALEDAENGKTENINDLFYASVKKIRELSEPEFLQIKARYGKLKGYLATDLNRLTKIYKKPPAGMGEDSEGKSGRTSKADMLIELVRSKCSFYHDLDFQIYVSFYVQDIEKDTGEVIGQHLEKWGLKSDGFKRWASITFFEAYEIGLGDSAFKDALATFEGLGIQGKEIEVNLRYGYLNEKIYVDLCMANWRIVEISKDGYKIIDNHESPVHFIRSLNSRPLPIPKTGGSVDLIWKHINNESEDSKVLVLAWLLEAMRICTPYPIIQIIGQQGSAKSSMQIRLKQLIDPHKGELIAAPRGSETMYRNSQGSHVVSYNNVSSLKVELQDTLCQFSTGGADSVKKHYSNDEVVILETKRPVLMNGISHLVTRDDLADRLISLELPRIPSTKRKRESALQESWEIDYPLITGALYELMSKTLAELPTVELRETPRMSDYAYLGQAMQNAREEKKPFLDIYKQVRDRTTYHIIEGSPVAQAIIELLKKTPNFTIKNTATYEKGLYIGTYAYLRELLESCKPSYANKMNYPASPKSLADAVRRLTPALLSQGIQVTTDKKRYKDGYRVTIQKIKTKPKPDNKPITF